ncbi:hypothetical protein SKAU_G00129790 [Synaphobranchus kaupii]|uniref:Uncharacterized protein n=1 Tax=Synaphobranchus kaupii TaxID=118154 RepID=A0A9Q1FR62_SYNKA|nr:hypothetical protein SKAU_G00129790 [Synaphobranchus kaupii]
MTQRWICNPIFDCGTDNIQHQGGLGTLQKSASQSTNRLIILLLQFHSYVRTTGWIRHLRLNWEIWGEEHLANKHSGSTTPTCNASLGLRRPLPLEMNSICMEAGASSASCHWYSSGKALQHRELISQGLPLLPYQLIHHVASEWLLECKMRKQIDRPGLAMPGWSAPIRDDWSVAPDSERSNCA